MSHCLSSTSCFATSIFNILPSSSSSLLCVPSIRFSHRTTSFGAIHKQTPSFPSSTKRKRLITRAAEYKFPDPIPEFADSVSFCFQFFIFTLVGSLCLVVKRVCWSHLCPVLLSGDWQVQKPSCEEAFEERFVWRISWWSCWGMHWSELPYLISLCPFVLKYSKAVSDNIFLSTSASFLFLNVRTLSSYC